MTLSIITINYNNRDGLKKTIDSVLAQTWTDYEWIVIDGGSTDGSRELIEQYQEHFAYWCSEPDKGVYNAMNKGIAQAKGEYMNFMNSGDTFYEAETLQKVFAERRTADVLYGDWINQYKNRKEICSIPSSDLQGILWRQNICHQAIFFRTIQLKQKGYDETFKLLADWKWNTDALLAGNVFEHLPCIVCRYDMYGMSNEKMTEEKKKECQRVLSCYPNYMKEALMELDVYQRNRYIQITKELNESNSFLRIITNGYLNLLFYTKLTFKKIAKLCHHK